MGQAYQVTLLGKKSSTAWHDEWKKSNRQHTTMATEYSFIGKRYIFLWLISDFSSSCSSFAIGTQWYWLLGTSHMATKRKNVYSWTDQLSVLVCRWSAPSEHCCLVYRPAANFTIKSIPIEGIIPLKTHETNRKKQNDRDRSRTWCQVRGIW